MIKMSEFEIFDERLLKVIQNTKLEKLATSCIWSEGPVWLSFNNSVLWSDIPNNRIMCWSETNGLSIWRDKVEFTNGHILDKQGNLLHCSHGQRAILRTPVIDGKILANTKDEVLIDNYQGKRLNSPNDIIVKNDDTIWFTDPPYGILSNIEGYKSNSELEKNYVFCFNPKTNDLKIVTDYLEMPNGLAFSPDEKFLYISDTSEKHQIVVFDVLENNELKNPRSFAEINPGLPDGFRVDTQGWIYTSSSDSVQIYDSNANLLGKILVPEKVGNLCFGGKNKNQMFIVASSSLYRITLNTQGIFYE